MKRIKFIIVTIITAFTFLSPLAACGDPVDDAADTIEGMAETKEKTQDALDAFDADAESKDAEYQDNLDMAE